MLSKSVIVLSVLYCTLLLLTIQSEAKPAFKHWAGLVSEGKANHREVQAGDIKHHSQIIAKRLSVGDAGEVSFKVERGTNTRFSVFTKSGRDNVFDLFIGRPAGKGRAANYANASSEVANGNFFSPDKVEDLFHEGVNAVSRSFVAKTPTANDGLFKIKLARKLAEATTDEAVVVVATDSPIKLQVVLDEVHILAGNPLKVSASFFDSSSDNTNPVGSVSSASLTVTYQGVSQTYALTADVNAGWVSTSFTPSVAGLYSIFVAASGLTAGGQEIERSYNHIFDVTDKSASLSGEVSVDDDGSELLISVGVVAAEGSTYKLYGELYGTDDNGALVDISYLVGASDVTGGALHFTVNIAWLQRTSAHAPYYLQNVRIADFNTHSTLSRSARLAARTGSGAVVSNSRVAQNISITDDIRVNKNPNGPRGASRRLLQTGHGLLLVHGYCAGSNPFPSTQFTSAYSFSDLNQARTHDQFAILIYNYGSVTLGLTGYGIVAHSQGGAAALHLYNYYWSGLDYATGSRLIQTVGTPYQGTAIAGNLALLGQLFGVGCGSVTDLTYSGATSWLSYISTSSRSKVYYHTTSFYDGWGYDYCHLATDSFLTDPDDGTTEKWAGQLTGANNLGHKQSWCHTTGMRDPPQCTDSARNSNMNTYAAR